VTADLQALPPDSIRAVLDRVFASPEYAWEIPRSPFALLDRLVRRVLLWLEALRGEHPTAYVALLVALALVLLVILAHFGYLIWLALRPGERVPGRLPAPPPLRDARWHLGEAARLAAQGRYADALAHRFLALVRELDGRRLVAFHPAKTPAEYVREARLDPASGAALAALVDTLYQCLFAGAPCGADELEAFSRAAEAVGARPGAAA
jgi:hypothetical protein